MVGSVGIVKSISRPLAIQEALNLLSALGADSKGTTARLLTEMKGVQDHNEAVLADATAAVVKADKRDAEIVKNEEKLARNIREAEELYANRLSSIVSSEKEFGRKMEEANAQISGKDEAISTREDKFNRNREEYQESIRINKEEFLERERLLNEDKIFLEGKKQDLGKLQSSINGREENVKSDEKTLYELRISLDKRLAKLDLRDARVRDAMKDQDVG